MMLTIFRRCQGTILCLCVRFVRCQRERERRDLLYKWVLSWESSAHGQGNPCLTTQANCIVIAKCRTMVQLGVRRRRCRLALVRLEGSEVGGCRLVDVLAGGGGGGIRGIGAVEWQCFLHAHHLGYC